jgi:hypothetical protein
MAIIKPNNNTLSSITALPAAITTGKVLQVVNSDNSYATDITSTTTTDVASSSGVTWQPTITPSSTSSKIIISANLSVQSSIYQSADVRSYVDILYKIGSGSYSSLNNRQHYSMYDYGGHGVSYLNNLVFQYLISPSTTSAITVKFTIASVNASGNTSVNYGDRNSTCILYEVAG